MSVPLSSPPGRRAVPAARREPARSADEAYEPALDPLGVSRCAELLYRSLVAGGAATADQLADRAAVEPAAVGGALEELAVLDLARQGDAQVWHAESPDLALASLVVRQQESLLQRQRQLERAQTAVRELVRLSHAHGRRHAGGDAVEVVDDTDSAVRRARHLAQAARESVAVLDRAPSGVWPAVRNDATVAGTPATDVTELLGRGLEVQAVYDRAALLAPGRFDLLRRLATDGAQARTLPDLPMTLVAYDRGTVLVHCDGRDDAGTVLVVHRSALQTGLLQLFDLLWERAFPLPPVADAPLPGAHTEQFDDVLVALLAAGFKDESIARHLGVSTSTVTRRMARLMEQTGSSTRFQLGMQAVRRSWI